MAGLPLPDVDMPDFAVPDAIAEIWSAVSWRVPIVIAVLVALDEIGKRRKRQRAAARRKAAEPAQHPLISPGSRQE